LFETFLLAFVPLFVAIDVFGSFPMFLTMTDRETPDSRRKIAGISTLTAMIVGSGFMFGGQAIMRFIGITISDFRVAGVVILLCFAVYDLLFSHLQRTMSEETNTSTIEQKHQRSFSLAVVPLGVPLIVGPAALTAVLLLVSQYGPVITSLAFALNILIVYLLFFNAHAITKRIPQAVLRAASKVVALFLAAIAVMMVRTGLTEMLSR
jgi:multiple antibiotic resistance protein